MELALRLARGVIAPEDLHRLVQLTGGGGSEDPGRAVAGGLVAARAEPAHPVVGHQRGDVHLHRVLDEHMGRAAPIDLVEGREERRAAALVFERRGRLELGHLLERVEGEAGGMQRLEPPGGDPEENQGDVDLLGDVARVLDDVGRGARPKGWRIGQQRGLRSDGLRRPGRNDLLLDGREAEVRDDAKALRRRVGGDLEQAHVLLERGAALGGHQRAPVAVVAGQLHVVADTGLVERREVLAEGGQGDVAQTDPFAAGAILDFRAGVGQRHLQAARAWSARASWIGR